MSASASWLIRSIAGRLVARVGPGHPGGDHPQREQVLAGFRDRPEPGLPVGTAPDRNGGPACSG
jgi:hypothetical protein